MKKHNRYNGNFENGRRYGEGAAFDPEKAPVRRNKKTVIAQIKVMALILVIAFVVAAGTSVLVSSLTSCRCDCHNDTCTGTNERIEPQAQTARKALQSTCPKEPTAIYFSTGGTSYGYDWTYSGDSTCTVISCHYDFASETYTFTAQGVYEGTDHVELMFKTNDENWCAVPVTVTVDKNLNVTVDSDI